jgi:hypothetical protein
VDLVAAGCYDAKRSHDAHNGNKSSTESAAKACGIVSETIAQDVDVA